MKAMNLQMPKQIKVEGEKTTSKTQKKKTSLSKKEGKFNLILNFLAKENGKEVKKDKKIKPKKKKTEKTEILSQVNFDDFIKTTIKINKQKKELKEKILNKKDSKKIVLTKTNKIEIKKGQKKTEKTSIKNLKDEFENKPQKEEHIEIKLLKNTVKNTIKTIHLSDSIGEKLATKIKTLISEKLTGNETNSNFDIKISLKPEHLGRISIQVRVDKVSGELQVNVFGQQQALNKISEYDKMISNGIKQINSGFSGINYKLAETQKKQKEKKDKEEKRKNIFANNKGRKLWM